MSKNYHEIARRNEELLSKLPLKHIERAYRIESRLRPQLELVERLNRIAANLPSQDALEILFKTTQMFKNDDFKIKDWSKSKNESLDELETPEMTWEEVISDTSDKLMVLSETNPDTYVKIEEIVKPIINSVSDKELDINSPISEEIVVNLNNSINQLIQLIKQDDRGYYRIPFINVRISQGQVINILMSAIYLVVKTLLLK